MNLIRGLGTNRGETYINLDTVILFQYQPLLEKLTVAGVATPPIELSGSLANDLAKQLRDIFHAEPPTADIPPPSGASKLYVP